MATELSTTQIALLEAIKASLFGIEPNYPSDTDWAEVVKEAKAQTILGIISPVIPVKDVSVEMGKATYMRLLFEQDKLIKLLDANDIPCVILKGYASASYYPKPCLRAMGDIDFLVPHDKIQDTALLLESNGYNYYSGKTEDDIIPKNVRHIEYKKNGIDYELHQSFSSPGFNIDDILENAIYNREYRILDGYRFPVLPEIENGLVLLGHINQHMRSGDLGLRQIIDWAMYINKVMNYNFWEDKFIPIAKSIGLDKLALSTTAMCIKYCGLPKNHSLVKQNEKSLDEYLNFLLLTGNFGRKGAYLSGNKNDKRIMFAMYTIKGYGFYHFFQTIGRSTWKTCQKHPFLIPFAWIYGIFRTLYKGITSNVKIRKMKKQFEQVKKRYSLYNSIGVKTKDKK